MAENTSPLRVGRYLLCDVIGGGGMANVHLGRALGAAGFSRVVAIKRLHPARAKDPRFTTMLVDEARLVSRIRHPNVVPTLDVVAVGSELLLVMEYVPGASISQLVSLAKARAAPIPLPIAVRIILDVLAGLGAAHSATSERGRALSIVHRDVSPQNVIAGTDGVARVVDFGIAKAEGKMSVTREGEIKGKLSYMAPEQLRGDEVDLRADLYSTGVILWELVTGRRLFEPSGDLAANIQRVLASAIPRASTVASVPQAVDDVLLRALAAAPAERYDSAAAMAEALEAATEAAKAKSVAAFVGTLAGAAIRQRDERVAAVEQLSTVYELDGERDDAGVPAETEALPAATERIADATRPLEVAPGEPTPQHTPQITQALPPAVMQAPQVHAPPRTLALAPALAPSPSRPPALSPSLPPPRRQRRSAGLPSAARLAALALGVLAVFGVAMFFAAGPGAFRGCTSPGAHRSNVAPDDPREPLDPPGRVRGRGNRARARRGELDGQAP